MKYIKKKKKKDTTGGGDMDGSGQEGELWVNPREYNDVKYTYKLFLKNSKKLTVVSQKASNFTLS